MPLNSSNVINPGKEDKTKWKVPKQDALGFVMVKPLSLERNCNHVWRSLTMVRLQQYDCNCILRNVIFKATPL